MADKVYPVHLKKMNHEGHVETVYGHDAKSEQAYRDLGYTDDMRLFADAQFPRLVYRIKANGNGSVETEKAQNADHLDTLLKDGYSKIPLVAVPKAERATAASGAPSARMEALEEDVADLKNDIGDIKAMLESLTAPSRKPSPRGKDA